MMRSVFLSLLLACNPAENLPENPHGNHGDAAMRPGSQPVAARPVAGSQPVDHTAHGSLPAGHAEVEVAPDRLQLIGVRTVRAQRRTLTTRIRANALIQPDEKREAHIHSKLMGWVEKLHVNAVGQRVKRGDALYTLFSQELYAAQLEYLRALRLDPEMAAAARQRLRLWGVPDDQVTLIETKGAQRVVTFRSPVSGIVLEKMILAGHYLDPEMMLYRIADLSQVWILAEVYEFEVDRLDPKGKAEVTVQGLTEPITAQVDAIYPTVDAATRTVKVRLVAPNPEGRLRPGAFAVALLPTRPVEGLTVPSEAVIDTGHDRIVYVAMSPGHFRPTHVETGHRADDRVEIRAGLAEGDEVVVGAQFLIDSESRLKGAGMPVGHGGH